MNFTVLIWEYAVAHGIDVHLASAIAQVESNLNPNVVRYEGHYQWLFKPEKFVNSSNTFITETIFQKTSFGLFQLMGANFRSLGFSGDWGLVFRPETQVEYAMKFLKNICNKYENDLDRIAAYNAGTPRKKIEDGREVYTNQFYVDKVLAQLLKTRQKGNVTNGGLT